MGYSNIIKFLILSASLLKKIALIVLLISSFCVKTQTPPKNNTKKNSVTNSTNTKKGKYGASSTQAALDTLRHTTCLNKQFSIVFYIVLDQTPPSAGPPAYPGVGLATPANLSLLMNELNNAFKPICVSFANCSTVFIPNYSYGQLWKKFITEPVVTASYYTDKTINFYIVDSINYSGITENQGYTYEPTTTNLSAPKKDLMVLEERSILQGNGAVVKHLLGHYFGLPHTHDEINPTPAAVPPPPTGVTSQEFVDKTNCYTHGDGFCDTDADSGDPTSFLKDGKGVYYEFPGDNLMSYYGPRCRFSQEQYNWMAHIIMTKRLYLH